MRHVTVEDESGRFLDPTAYLDLLPSFADSLPPGARAFATDPGHYDFFGKRCVKDLKPDTVLRGETAGEPWLRLVLRHSCWKHEEDLTIRYVGVRDLGSKRPTGRVSRRSRWTRSCLTSTDAAMRSAFSAGLSRLSATT